MSARKTSLPPGSPQAWLRHAESDLALANLALEREEILVEQVCFHAQQGVDRGMGQDTNYSGLKLSLIALFS